MRNDRGAVTTVARPWPERAKPPSWDVSPTSAGWGREPLENQGPLGFSVTIGLASLPGLYWTYDLYRHPKGLVQNPVVGLGGRAATNPQNSVLVRRQHDRRNLVRGQQVANRRPGRVNLLTQQRRLDGNQQVICQDAEEDVRFYPVLEMMENGTLA